MAGTDICTVVVNSCDYYEEAWFPFFELVKKFWPDRNMEIVLNTETKNYEDMELEVRCLHSDPAMAWSDRLISVLNRVHTKYIILLLDDFFLQGYTDQKEIENCISYMENDSQIAVFYFKHITGHHSVSKKYQKYYEMDVRRKYILNFQAAVWNRKVLLGFLESGKSPWEIEEEGHACLRTDKKFYCAGTGSYYESDKNVFDYLWAEETGYGICKSKWLWNNKKLFKKHKIHVVYRRLGYMTYFEYVMKKIKKRIFN